LIVAPRGENSGMAKLTEKQVLEIREIGNAISQRKIASIYGICHSMIGSILRRENWTHI